MKIRLVKKLAEQRLKKLLRSQEEPVKLIVPFGDAFNPGRLPLIPLCLGGYLVIVIGAHPMYTKAQGSKSRSERIRALTVEFPRDLRISITKSAADLEISSAQLIRDAVTAYLERLGVQQQQLDEAA